jgi:GT2 family glycosyltransferase
MRVESTAVFDELQRFLEDHPRAAVAAPLQFKSEGPAARLNFTWSYYTPQAFAIYLGRLLGRRTYSHAPIRVGFLNAGCLFIRRSAFESVGRLNEKYFLYGEEPDLFLKFRRHGYECWLLPAVSVVHVRERSLQTVSLTQRLRFKLMGVGNILDALARGWGSILVDKITGPRP